MYLHNIRNLRRLSRPTLALVGLDIDALPRPRHGYILKQDTIDTKVPFMWPYTANRRTETSQYRVLNSDIVGTGYRNGPMQCRRVFAVDGWLYSDTVIGILDDAIVNDNIPSSWINPIRVEVLGLMEFPSDPIGNIVGEPTGGTQHGPLCCCSRQ